MEEERSTDNLTQGSSAGADAPRSISERKLAANRQNSKKSPGPRTEGGKARSSQNAFRHGFFAAPLYPTSAQVALDRSEFDDLIAGLREHYQPDGYIENMLVEKIAASYVRSARLLRHEQRIFECRYPFEARSSASLPRYQTAVERQLAKDIERLEILQERRKAEMASGEEGKPELHAEVELAAGTGVELSPAADFESQNSDATAPQTESEPSPAGESGARAGDDESPVRCGEENAGTNPPGSVERG